MKSGSVEVVSLLFERGLYIIGVDWKPISQSALSLSLSLSPLSPLSLPSLPPLSPPSTEINSIQILPERESQTFKNFNVILLSSLTHSVILYVTIYK